MHLLNLLNVQFLSHTIRIGWAAHNLKTHKTEEPAIINSVYVRFITPQVRIKLTHALA